MRGVFEHKIFGRYNVQGEEPIDFLWDLFDQLVLDEEQSRPHGDRARLREGREWVRRHSAYFCRLLSRGKLLYPLEIPQALYFDFHCIALLGGVLKENDGYLDLAPDPVRVLNQLLVEGALELRLPGRGPDFGVMSPDEVTRARLLREMGDQPR